jgi:protein SCO1/2
MKILRNIIYFVTSFCLLFDPVKLFAQEQKTEVGIDEKLGDVLTADLKFYDELGQLVQLKSLITKPTIITLVYYRCPGICSPLLNGLSETVQKMDLEAGMDYNIVTISFDPSENYITAGEKKKNYLENMKKQVPEQSWRFLTGDSVNITKLTNEVGFMYQKQDNEFIHSAAVVVVSPEGKIARYLYGIQLLPLDLKLAIIEASEGKTGPTINKFLKLCYSYDPEGRKYVLNVTRIAGTGVFLFIVIFFIVLVVKKKNETEPVQEKEPVND